MAKGLSGTNARNDAIGMRKNNNNDGSEKLAELSNAVQAQGAAIMRIIQHLNELSSHQNTSLMSIQERRDIFEQLVHPSDEMLPALTDISPLMATLLPIVDIIRWNYTPKSERPINPATGKPYGLYWLWERSFALWSLSKNAHHTIRLCDVVQSRASDQTRMGVVAE